MKQPRCHTFKWYDAIVYQDIHTERIKAHEKHLGTAGSIELTGPADPAWLPILTEELGEVARELCPDHLGRPRHLLRLREELIQVAAMAAAWIDAIDEYRSVWTEEVGE